MWYNCKHFAFDSVKARRDCSQVSRYLPYVLTVFAVLAVFAGTAGFSYIGLDDAGYTFRNPFVATGLSLSNVVESFTNFSHGGIWMPITYISYMIDIELSRFFGVTLSVWMHLVNVLFHALNAVMLFHLARRVGAVAGGRGSSFALLLAVLFWAIHPLRAEPVAWIACRKEMLWGFFSLSAMVFWLRSLVDEGRPVAIGLFRLAALLLFAAACLSKPSAMCFPVLALALHLLLRFGAEQGREGCRFTPPVRACYAAMFVLAGGTAIAAAYSQTHVAGQEAVALFAAPLHHRIVHALSALGFYVRATVWPSGLHVDCRIVEGIMPLGGVGNLIALALAALAALSVAVRVRIWRISCVSAACVFSFVWFIVPLVPTLGLLGSFGIEAHADRFAYLPTMSVVFLAALVPVPSCAARLASRAALRRAMVLAVAAYAVAAFRQTRFWSDDHTAHRRALECDPLHPRAMVHVGDALCARFRDFDKGIALYRKSLALRPREYVKYRLAYALASRGNWDDFLEVKRLGADVAKDPSLDGRGMMLDALGTAYMVEGDWENAVRMFKASIDAPGRFWPKASTRRKLDECLERIN